MDDLNADRCSVGVQKSFLSMKACKDDENTCDDGLCLPIDRRCNDRPECKDKSDELMCTILVQDESYKKDLSPPPGFPAEKLGVNISINVISLSSFDANTGSFEAKLTVTMTWIEQRLRFGNLRENFENVVIFIEVQLFYSGPMMLMIYEARSIKKQQDKKGLKVEILIVRRLLSLTLTPCVPTVLPNFTGLTSNFFKNFFVEAIIGLKVTVMLVFATMFIISDKFPGTAYVWPIFSLLKPFIDIIVQTYIETLRSEREETEVNHHGKSVKIAAVGSVMDIAPSTRRQNDSSLTYNC